MGDRNPYQNDTPEYQLWENMTSSRLLAETYNNDAANYLQKSQAARERAELYQAAIEKLTKALN